MTKKEAQIYQRKYRIKNRKKLLNYQRKWYQEHKKEIQVYNKKYVKKHKKEKQIYDRKYQAKHKKRLQIYKRIYSQKYRLKHPILISLRNHHWFIFNSRNHKQRFYKGMPFESRWNPEKGGSFLIGEKELLSAIGPKPNRNASLHVIDHNKGIILGNLVRTTSQVQNREQMCKIIADLRHENSLLKKQLIQLRAKINDLF